MYIFIRSKTDQEKSGEREQSETKDASDVFAAEVDALLMERAGAAEGEAAVKATLLVGAGGGADTDALDAGVAVVHTEAAEAAAGVVSAEFPLTLGSAHTHTALTGLMPLAEATGRPASVWATVSATALRKAEGVIVRRGGGGGRDGAGWANPPLIAHTPAPKVASPMCTRRPALQLLAHHVVVVSALLDDAAEVYLRLQPPVARLDVRDVDPLAVEVVGIEVAPSRLEALAGVDVLPVSVGRVAHPKGVDDRRAALRRPHNVPSVFVHQPELLPREKVRMVMARMPPAEGRKG
jgi:hypothetical protein